MGCGAILSGQLLTLKSDSCRTESGVISLGKLPCIKVPSCGILYLWGLCFLCIPTHPLACESQAGRYMLREARLASRGETPAHREPSCFMTVTFWGAIQTREGLSPPALTLEGNLKTEEAPGVSAETYLPSVQVPNVSECYHWKHPQMCFGPGQSCGCGASMGGEEDLCTPAAVSGAGRSGIPAFGFQVDGKSWQLLEPFTS